MTENGFPVKVLMVCLGNICRSPMAEALFQQMVTEAGVERYIVVDSAGTGGWHIGELAHRGTRNILAEYGIEYNGRARQLSAADTADANSYIFAMDDSNIREIISRFGKPKNMYRLLDFAPNSPVKDVPDPYYSGNFEMVYELVEEGCKGAFDFILEDAGIPVP